MIVINKVDKYIDFEKHIPLVSVKKVSKGAIIPTKGSSSAAGFDLYADLNGNDMVAIEPGGTIMIGTGIAVKIPDGYFGCVFARSGVATKRGIRPANCVGVIDSDYTGEIKMPLHNDTSKMQYITNNERVAQLVIMPYMIAYMNEVENLEHTDRGANGFGSTGSM